MGYYDYNLCHGFLDLKIGIEIGIHNSVFPNEKHQWETHTKLNCVRGQVSTGILLLSNISQ